MGGAYDKSTVISNIPVDYIEAAELKQRIDDGLNFICLDVRDSDEVGVVSKNAGDKINIPLDQLKKRIYELEKYKETTLITVCTLGKRAIRVAQILKSKGFVNVVCLRGGVGVWEKLQ
jgi:rhodanese-related sulfurtransferase